MDQLTFMFMRSYIIVGIVRLKTTGRKSCPKVTEYSLQQSFSKGKKWWQYVNRFDSTLANINPEVTGPPSDGVSYLRFERKKCSCYLSMGITLSIGMLVFWACQSLDMWSQPSTSTWLFENMWHNIMTNTTHVHTCNLYSSAAIVIQVLCNFVLCCWGFHEDICNKSCW